MRKSLPILFKLFIAALAMYIAFRQVNPAELQVILLKANWAWLIPAVLLFNGSQFTSTWRLLQFYQQIAPSMPYRYNLQLYYSGMFYNLFLPGGIGGDVYKVARLKKSGLPLKALTVATLLDRISGLLALLSVIVITGMWLNIKGPPAFHWLLPSALMVTILLYFLLVKHFFKPFARLILPALLVSVLVQLLQVLAFICILHFAEPASKQEWTYALLFFASSIVAAIPFSIGGIGTRELAMSAGAVWLHVSPTIAVSASLLFLIITALSALTGWSLSKRETLLFDYSRPSKETRSS